MALTEYFRGNSCQVPHNIYENCCEGSLKQRKKCSAGTDGIVLQWVRPAFKLELLKVVESPLSYPPRKIRRKTALPEQALSRTAGEKKLVLVACLLPLQIGQTPTLPLLSQLGTGILSCNSGKTTVWSCVCLQRSLQFKMIT